MADDMLDDLKDIMETLGAKVAPKKSVKAKGVYEQLHLLSAVVDVAQSHSKSPPKDSSRLPQKKTSLKS